MAWSVPKIGAVAAAASGNITLAEPAGIASGDLMIACIGYRSNAAFAVPGDWNLVATQQSSGDTDATNGIASGLMMWCVRGGSAPTLTFTRTAGDVAQGQIIAYSGGHATPYDTGSANTLAVANAQPTTTTFNTAEAGELIVAMTSMGDNIATTSFDATDTAMDIVSSGTDTTNAPSEDQWRMRANTTTGTGADHGLAIGDVIRATAGATGTVFANSGTAARHVMIAGAFKLAPPTINLAGTSAGTSTAAADVQLTKNLVGSSAGTSTAVAALKITKNLAGSSAGTSTADADLSVATLIELAGASGGTSTAAAGLSVTKNLAASSAGVSTAAATFSITKNLGATSSGIGQANGTLLVTKNFAGASAGSSAATASLSITHNLAGLSAGTSTAVADLTVSESGDINLAGTSAGTSTASASLNVTKNLAGSSAGLATAEATLGITKNLSGLSSGTGSAQASLAITRNLSGASNGVATATATLSVSSIVLTPPLTIVLNSGEKYVSLVDSVRTVNLDSDERYIRLED